MARMLTSSHKGYSSGCPGGKKCCRDFEFVGHGGRQTVQPRRTQRRREKAQWKKEAGL